MDTLKRAALNGNFTDFSTEYLRQNPNATMADASAAYLAYRSAYGVGSRTTQSRTYSSLSDKNFSIGGLLNDIIKTQSISKSGYNLEFTEIKDGINLVFDENTRKLRNVTGMFSKAFDMGVQGLVTYFQEAAVLQNKINEKTSLTGEMSKNFRDSIMDASVYGNRLAISFDTIADGMAKLIKDAGRFKLVGESTINNISLQSKVFFDSFDEAVGSLEEFQKVSRGVSDGMKIIEKSGKKTLELGLNAKTTVKTMVQNLEKLNQFGFKNGVEGLTRMIQKAQALRMDLSDAFNIAEKVMDPTNALSLAANLQVIGGALGDFNDPIKMMWMATNNVQGLQDALAETAESLVTFDQKSGAFEIVGADLRRARALSEQLGVSLKEVTNLAIQSAQRTSASVDLLSSGLKMNDEDREFLTNIAQMNKGRMVIETKDKRGKDIEIALESMTQEQANYLLSQKEEFKKMSTMDIARKQVSVIENINRDVSYIAATARLQLAKTIDKDFFQKGLGFDPKAASNLTKEMADEANKSLVTIFSGASDKLGEIITEKVKSENKETSKENVTNNQQPQTSNVNLTITGRSDFDELTRLLLKNPEFIQRILDGDYINYEGVKS